MKTTRQQAIYELIDKYNIDTQEELISRLEEAGFQTTQATVSRDIREMNLVKAVAPDGVYKYVRPTRNESQSPRFNSALASSVTDIDVAGNMLVIHAYPGMAQPIASCIDALGHSEILGCVGGDDTVIAVIRDASRGKELCEKIRQLLKTV